MYTKGKYEMPDRIWATSPGEYGVGFDAITLGAWDTVMMYSDDVEYVRASTITPIVEAAKEFLESGPFYDREYLSQDLNNKLDALRTAILEYEGHNG